MNRRIVLWDSRRHTSQATDEAGTTITKSVHPAAHEPGPYESETNEPHVYVPSLAYFALKSLFEYPEQMHVLGSVRLQYQAPSSPLSYDVLRELIPFYDPSDPNFSLSQVDPRLWATLVQIFSDLPDSFRTYHIPLSDKHVPLLQKIPSTPYFSLITILELPSCPELTDETIFELKHLRLCALDASGTMLSTHGVKNLSRTLTWSEEGVPATRERRGPWTLRILNLRNCKNVDNGIFICLPKFVLLCIVDLRGTRCNPNACDKKPFRPSNNKAFFYPSPLSSSLALLSSAATNDSPLFSSPDLYTVHITSLNHESESQISHSSLYGRRQARSKPSVGMQDMYVVLPPSQSYTKVRKELGLPNLKPKIRVGNSHTLERNRERREEMEKHERNKEAWYERNDNWARNGVNDWPEQGCEDPYGYGERMSSTDEDGLSSDDEDGSEDEGLGGDSDAINLDLSLLNRPRASVATLTLTSRPDSGSALPSTSSGSSSRGQLSGSGSRLSHPATPNRPVAVSTMPGPQSVSRGYRRRPRARVREGGILRRHPTPNTGVIPNGRITTPWLNNSHGNSEPNQQMATAVSRPGQRVRPNSSTVLDVGRTRPPQASRSAPELVPISPLNTPHSMPTTITQLSQPDVDIQTSVASEEAHIYATRQAAAAFYLDPHVGTASSPGHSRLRPLEPLYRGPGRPSAADEQLMLFREPPPWNVLEDSRVMVSTNNAKETQRAQGGAAVLGRSSTKAADGMKELMQMVKRRKLAEPGVTVNVKVPGHLGVVTNPMSRNPFRKKDNPEGFAQRSSGRATTPSRPPLATMSAPLWTNSIASNSAKPHKPNSTVVVPALPGELQRAQMESLSRQTSSEHKRQSLDVGGPKTTPTSHTHVPKSAVSANSRSKARPHGPLPDLLQSATGAHATNRNPAQGARISIKSSDGVPPRNQPRSPKVPTTFDWKGWGVK